ncbi:hypothetical protein P7D22_14485 [Lichenihabitans sp. Uapishka_5]|uniref:hypothetical protein n=1 Tax=Lichenihabitans sp. Uapishka_5 TaxID=3037302 RepID=UPI0029E80F54|nr:hypothetical protein [Lichenihabitans sp. Uapishka_5]MDX7952375.1 hypothetical protein [Lichenihabitans sp. Uapishka_5]
MQHDLTTLAGAVTALFAHRFTVQGAAGAALADLGPKGAERIDLAVGDHVVLSGEPRPSELKVHSIVKAGAPDITIEHPQKATHGDHDHVDPAAASKVATDKGFAILGKARRKPRPFEILGRDPGGELDELHIDFDGCLRKTQPVIPGERNGPRTSRRLWLNIV